MQDDKTTKQFEKWGKTPPSHQPHGIKDGEFEQFAKRLMPYKWRLEGNILKGMTQMGELAQTIPTDYILTGTDERGMPIFEKVKV